MGELQKVEPEAHKVQLSTGELQYDVLVIATGTKSNYFDNVIRPLSARF